MPTIHTAWVPGAARPRNAAGFRVSTGVARVSYHYFCRLVEALSDSRRAPRLSFGLRFAAARNLKGEHYSQTAVQTVGATGSGAEDGVSSR